MKLISKSFALFLIVILAVSSLIIVESASTSIPKPSAPEFNVRYVDHSYDEPAVYDIDPYTGNTVVTQGGYHVQNNSVEIVIKNQDFTSYHNENGSRIWLYYNVAIKGHFENWPDQNWASGTLNIKISESYPTWYIPMSESGSTLITYGILGNNGTETAYKYRAPTYGTPRYYGYFNYALENISVGGQVDIKIQSIIGYSTKINEGLGPMGYESIYYVFTGETSSWSNTQTITINQSTPTTTPSQSTTSPTQNPTVSPTQSGTGAQIHSLSIVEVVVVALLLVVAVLLVFVVFYLRKQSVGHKPV